MLIVNKKRLMHDHLKHWPWIVAVTCLVCDWVLNSMSQIPCHVPNPKTPFVIGILSDTPVKQLLIWAGMSSGPS